MMTSTMKAYILSVKKFACGWRHVNGISDLMQKVMEYYLLILYHLGIPIFLSDVTTHIPPL